jgi:hypothetical protein
MWTFLKNLFRGFYKPVEPELFLGVIADPRSNAEKELDPIHEEISAGLPIVTWIQKQPSEWNHSTLRKQDLSAFDCVAFSTTTGVQNDKGLTYILSAHDIYDQRSNYPYEGMYPFEGVQLPAKMGVLPDSMAPSDGLTEDQLNVHLVRTPETIAKAAEIAGGIPTRINTPTDIDTVAGIISQKMATRLCFHFTLSEWTSMPQLFTDGTIHHQVIGVDYAIVNGQKCIIVQDSCFTNNAYVPAFGLRVISEAFLKARCYAATYIKPFVPVPPPPPIQHIFTIDMKYGDKNNEVLLLQQRLATLGYFHVTPTGYFGGITKQAVIAYQKDNGLPMTGYVGVLTRAKLNI